MKLHMTAIWFAGMVVVSVAVTIPVAVSARSAPSSIRRMVTCRARIPAANSPNWRWPLSLWMPLPPFLSAGLG